MLGTVALGVLITALVIITKAKGTINSPTLPLARSRLWQGFPKLGVVVSIQKAISAAGALGLGFALVEPSSKSADTAGGLVERLGGKQVFVAAAQGLINDHLRGADLCHLAAPAGQKFFQGVGICAGTAASKVVAVGLDDEDVFRADGADAWHMTVQVKQLLDGGSGTGGGGTQEGLLLPSTPFVFQPDEGVLAKGANTFLQHARLRICRRAPRRVPGRRSAAAAGVPTTGRCLSDSAGQLSPLPFQDGALPSWHGPTSGRLLAQRRRHGAAAQTEKAANPACERRPLSLRLARDGVLTCAGRAPGGNVTLTTPTWGLPNQRLNKST